MLGGDSNLRGLDPVGAENSNRPVTTPATAGRFELVCIVNESDPSETSIGPGTLQTVDERRSTPSEKKSNEDAAAAQRQGTRRLSLEDRLQQNDSMSRFRADALRSRLRQA